MQIAPLLNIGRGVTALIGGGGKTTLLYTLTEELRKKGTVLLCTSTHIMRPTQYEVLERAGEAELSAALSRARRGLRRGAVRRGKARPAVALL